ncbi:hypothetical protein ACFY89_08520 [Achromobacter spanius]|uniref:hypothetical protein n=1 Tax=Achromobacter spanius TaxID=217203 RepID=UPI0036E66029
MKTLLLIALVVAYPSMSRAADSAIPCDVADALAEKAYQRVSSAMSNHQRAVAVVANQAFWDLKEYASACPRVASRASDLLASGFHGYLLDPWSEAVLEGVNRDSVKGPFIPPELAFPMPRTTQGSGGFTGEYKNPTAKGLGSGGKQEVVCKPVRIKTSIGGSAIVHGRTPPPNFRMYEWSTEIDVKSVLDAAAAIEGNKNLLLDR